MKERKKLASIIGICSLLTMLWGCQQSTKTTQPESTTTLQQPTTQDASKITTATTQNIQKLTISNKCIGCGRCRQIAPSNFAMGGSQAEVISQENISSSAVQQAMANCPVQAIQIIEA